MKATSRLLFMVITCCHMAVGARCQQMATERGGPSVHIIGGVATPGHTENTRGDVVTKRAAAYPATNRYVKEALAGIFENNNADASDTLVTANEADSTESRDSTGISGALQEPGRITVMEIPAAGTSSYADGLWTEPIDPLASKYAEMISIDPQDINNYPLYRFVDNWYGVRYKWGGDDVSGIDCSAFSQKLYSKVYGKEILRTTKQQHKNCERIKHADEAEEGDLVFFRIHRFRVSHVGIYLANGYFVHASRSQGVTISSLNNRYWHKRFAFCGRVAKEENSNLESDSIQ